MEPRSPQPDSRPAAAHKSEDTDPTGPTPHARPLPGGSPYPFLAPPQRPDELGRLGQYRILGELGRGGMGVVFRAEDTALGRLVAVKVMLSQAADAVAKARFGREARSQAKIEHDHVAVIYHVAEHDGFPYLVMPLLKGVSLAEALGAGARVPAEYLIRIAREVAEGLAAAHAVGLVHRDIKPANIWLEGPRKRVKILDFGLVRGITDQADASPGASYNGQLTIAGASVGTPAYMSPEQAKGLPVDHRADLFAVGVVLYQMATGVLPFTGPGKFAVMAAVVAHEPPPPVALAPDLPPALSHLICRLLSKDPDGRPPSAEAVARELTLIKRGLAERSAAPAHPVQAHPWPAAHAPANPWNELDFSSSSAEKTSVAPEPPAPEPKPSWPLWVGVAVALAAAGGLIAALLPTRANQTEEAKPEPPGLKPPDPPETGFFNGRNLNGWRAPVGLWQVADGSIVGTYRVGHPQDSYLSTRRSYADFELTFQVRLTGAGRSGVAIRGRPGPPSQFLVAGPRCEIGPGSWGRLTGGKNVVMQPAAPDVEPSVRPGDFNDFTVRCIGKRVMVAVNGVVSLDGEFPVPDEGVIGFRMATDEATPSEVAFRNIKFTDLGKSTVEPDCAAAVWALSLNAPVTIRYNGAERALAANAPLPVGAWQLAGVSLQGLPGVGDADLANFKGVKGLTSLNLSGTGVTDAGLANLKGCTRLTSLDLSNTQVTDETLAVCGRFTKLTSLNVSATGVTEAGVRKLADQLTGCRIQWNGGTVGLSPP